MPWELNGNAGIGASHFLGTRNAAPLIIRTENGGTSPVAAAEAMRITPAAGGRRVGIRTPNPLYQLHVTAPGGVGPEDANGVSQAGNVPIVAQSDSTAFAVLNANGRQAFALNIDGNQGTTNARGVPTLYDKYDGSWQPCLSLRSGSVGIGTGAPQRRLHVEDTEIHSGGSGSGFSFGNRQTAGFVQNPGGGERWVWYASGGIARLWSGSDKLTVMTNGDVALSGKHAFRSSDPWLRLNQDGAFSAGVHTPGLLAPGSLNVGGVGGWSNPGTGNAEIGASLATHGTTPGQQLNTSHNPAGATTGPGFPSWSGGGINTWDVLARGAVYVGTNIDSPQVQIYANGTLIAPDKRFRIDHPLDPERRFLVHACLEGPESAVYYRGQGQLEGGRARVELPEYFEALVRTDDRTVTLTPCCAEDEPISVLAASGIADGAFDVRAADDRNPRQSFYWEVKAVRADMEPLQTEERKGERNSGATQGPALSTRAPEIRITRDREAVVT